MFFKVDIYYNILRCRKYYFYIGFRFQKLVWSGAGVIAGGCDGGLLEFYNADKLLNNASDALVSSSSKHNGKLFLIFIILYI